MFPCSRYLTRNVQIGRRGRGQCTRYGSQYCKYQTRDETVFAICIFEYLPRSHGSNETNGTHREKSNGGITCRKTVHFLCHKHNVVDNILIAAIAG